MKKFIVVCFIMISVAAVHAQGSTPSLPIPLFIQLLDSTEQLVLNHSSKFEHVDLPKKFHATFNSYIRDSTARELPGLKPKVYYNWTLKNGKVINGDVYWDETCSYIVFKIDGSSYVNLFSRAGVRQLRTLFKL